MTKIIMFSPVDAILLKTFETLEGILSRGCAAIISLISNGGGGVRYNVSAFYFSSFSILIKNIFIKCLYAL